MVSDPSKALQPPRVERKMPEILSIAEVDLLLRQPKTDTPKGIRDKAMLEMLYATGIRVSEPDPFEDTGCQPYDGLHHLPR